MRSRNFETTASRFVGGFWRDGECGEEEEQRLVSVMMKNPSHYSNWVWDAPQEALWQYSKPLSLHGLSYI